MKFVAVRRRIADGFRHNAEALLCWVSDYWPVLSILIDTGLLIVSVCLFCIGRIPEATYVLLMLIAASVQRKPE